MARSNAKVVPESAQALYELKYEIAEALGLPVYKPHRDAYRAEFSSELGEAEGEGQTLSISKKEDWGDLSAREAGAVGGYMTARLVQRAQETMLEL